jgi:hypothetical protein
MLGSATAQLNALRNQANVAVADGDVATLRQLAQRAVAVGVAAGASAESLAGDITSALATAQGDQPDASQSSADPTTAKLPAGPSALGLDPTVIAQLFDPPASTEAETSATAMAADPSSGLSGGLQMITSLNARAGSVITEARSLLAAMNTAITAATGPGGVQSGAASGSTTGSNPDALSMNSLAGLLDQAESSMSARIFAATQQIGGSATAAKPATTQPDIPQSTLNLKA